MFTRRTFSLAAVAALGAPYLARARTEDLSNAIGDMPQLHSLLVRHEDDTIFAQAPRVPGLDRPANIKSCSKSIVALLLGAAIERGEIPSVEARLSEVAPRLLPADATPSAENITMEDLVTLRAGLQRTSGSNYGGWINSPNWISDALTRPMVAEPGGRMIYSTGSTHILGAALAEATGKTLLAQARERLGAPLGIDVPAWTRDPQGYYLGGNEMAITPRSMLKIAVLLRDRGVFDGAEVVPKRWISESTRPHGRSAFSGLSYGYGWFLTSSGYALARGYGGQIIAAHSRRRLAVAITSDPTRPARSGGYFGELLDLLNGPILALS
ncbi:serine hydrolase [Ruegeria sp. 2205SS24-7]|uniref:serine hydrolase domain-containing protein n=1 Tax=Ruegeria discodermiae TaxID=3064389 RepID=UPI0027418E54|nr:serine hydrolase [Ruegeria sp. 2205SS24-7]MDP5221048.1 serine hydrolase [Ruegeria sp. 2205SS24-7]